MLTFWSQTAGFQNWENINFCCVHLWQQLQETNKGTTGVDQKAKWPHSGISTLASMAASLGISELQDSISQPFWKLSHLDKQKKLSSRVLCRQSIKTKTKQSKKLENQCPGREWVDIGRMSASPRLSLLLFFSCMHTNKGLGRGPGEELLICFPF